MKNNGGQDIVSRNGFRKLPVLSLFSLLAFAGIAALFLIKLHTTPVTVISQSEFLDKFASSQIVSATVRVNQQKLPLSEINGICLGTDKDGKAVQIPFVVHNAWFTQQQLNQLTRSQKISISAPNVVVMNLLWGIAPFLFLTAPFFIFGIVALVILRAKKRNPPGAV
jgi:hypothetical protein